MSSLQPPTPTQPQVVYVEAPKKKRGLFKKLLLACGVFFGLIVMIAVVASTSGDTKTDSPAAGDAELTSAATAAPAAGRSAIDYEQILDDIDGMTDAQFDRYAADASKNNRADRWSATVFEVDDQVLGSDYFAHLTVNPGDTLDVMEISIDIAEDVALDLNLKDEIVFSGEIRDLTNTLGLPVVYLNKVTVHSKQAG